MSTAGETMAARVELRREPSLSTGAVKESTSAVERSVDLLAELVASTGPVRITDLARRMKLPKSTVHRILAVFVSRGIAARVNGSYMVGSAFLRIAEDARPDRIQGAVMPILLELYERTRCAVGIGVLSHGHVVYSNALRGRDRCPLPLGPAPAYRTAAGRVLLAFEPDLTSQLAAVPDSAVATLLAELATIRRKWFLCVRDGERDVFELAAPVFDRTGRILAAIRLAGAGADRDAGWLAAQLRQTAQGASAALTRGCPGWDDRVPRGA